MIYLFKSHLRGRSSFKEAKEEKKCMYSLFIVLQLFIAFTYMPFCATKTNNSFIFKLVGLLCCQGIIFRPHYRIGFNYIKILLKL